jgi:heterotetrameric sarcosine oxidase gamma subunit
MSATFQSPVTNSYEPTAGAALTLTDESSKTKMIVRAAAGTPARASLAQVFAGSRTSNGVLIAGSRPDEWMLIGDADVVSTWVHDLSTDGHVSVIDWTHGRAQFRLTGEVAASALEKVCGLDWSDAMMPNGAVTSGSVAKVTCDLIRNDVSDNSGGATPSYLILCDRSFGQYLFDTIIDSGNEFDISAHT